MILFLTSSPYVIGADRALLSNDNEFVDRIRAVLPPYPRALFIAADPENRAGTCRFGADTVAAFSEAALPVLSHSGRLQRPGCPGSDRAKRPDSPVRRSCADPEHLLPGNRPERAAGGLFRGDRRHQRREHELRRIRLCPAGGAGRDCAGL